MIIIQPAIRAAPISDAAAELIIWTYGIGCVVILALIIYMWWDCRK